MTTVSVLGDSVVGNGQGTITNCRFASSITTPCGPLAFVGDQVTVSGDKGTHVGIITTGNNLYTAPDGSAVAVVGISQFIAGPYSGTVVGPGCPGYEAI